MTLLIFVRVFFWVPVLLDFLSDKKSRPAPPRFAQEAHSHVPHAITVAPPLTPDEMRLHFFLFFKKNTEKWLPIIELRVFIFYD